MKLFRKAMLAVITMVLAVVAIVVPANRTTKVEAATIPAGQTLYLQAGTWDVDGARFAAYFFDGTAGQKWVSMEAVEPGIYKVAAPSNGTSAKVIFCRMNGSTTTNNWDNKWNQSPDLTWDGSKNLYKVTGWETGSWTTFTPGQMTVGMVGSINGWANDVNLAYNSETQKYETIYTFAVGDEFKIRLDGKWDNSFGAGKLDSASKAYASGTDNIKITVAGTYVVSMGANISLTPYVEPELEVTASVAWQQGTLNDAAALRIVVVLEGLTTENVADFAKEISITTTHAGIADTQVVDVLFTGVVDLATGDAITGDLYAVLTYTNIPTGEYAIEVLFDGAVVATETATIA